MDRVVTVTFVPQTAQNYQDAYLQQLIREGAPPSALHAFAYDTVWVAASALAQVMEAVKHREKFSTKRNVPVGEDEVQEMLLEAVKETQFEGVTVRNRDLVTPENTTCVLYANTVSTRLVTSTQYWYFNQY